MLYHFLSISKSVLVQVKRSTNIPSFENSHSQNIGFLDSQAGFALNSLAFLYNSAQLSQNLQILIVNYYYNSDN
jgi:hypothetical protein